MTEDQRQLQLIELYDIMEDRLANLDITFDEFIVLYKAFRSNIEPKQVEETPKTNTNPFPWAQAAGTGWS